MTAKEWFLTLPEPYGQMAINNTSKIKLKEVYEQLSLALVFSFTWKFTDEGFDFWEAIHDNIFNS